MTCDSSDYGRCETCDKYASLQRDGFCVGCTWTLLTDGTHLRSGWTSKQQLTITFASENQYEQEGENIWQQI